MANTMFESNISGYLLVKRGKMRDIYSAGNKTHLIIIATDRISCFDVILPTAIPDKGIVLTQLSNFWFERTKHIIPSHIVNPDSDKLPEPIFTPSTKEDAGHDVNVTQEYIEKEIGEEIVVKTSEKYLQVFKMITGRELNG